MNNILKCFPELTVQQKEQFAQLLPLYKEWNSKINVVSRKDIDNLYLHHVLHSLAIAKITNFKEGTRILDVGTGGGFPGIPLAIMFPQASFHLVDSIGKKITVVDEIVKVLALKNVTTQVIRAENIKQTYHYIVSRAVTDLKVFTGWCFKNIDNNNFNNLPNGILYLKGGDIKEELNKINSMRSQVFPIKTFFDDDYFAEKHIVYITRQ